jgi:hypothetical protein
MWRFIGGSLDGQCIDCGDEHRFVSHGKTELYRVAVVDGERVMRLVATIKSDPVGVGRRGAWKGWK